MFVIFKEQANVPKSIRNVICKLLPYSIGAFVLLLVIQGLLLLSPVIMQRMLDHAIPQRDGAQILALTALFIGIPIASALGQALYQYTSAIVSRKHSFQITRQAITRIVGKPMTFHDANTSGELAAQAGKDASGLILLFVKDIPEVLATLLVAPIAFLLLVRMHPAIALAQLLYIPCLLIPSRLIGRRVNENAEKIFSSLARMRAFVQEMLRGVKIVKLSGILPTLLKRYEGMFMGNSKLFAKTAALETFLGGITVQMLSSFFTGIGFLTGVYLMTRDAFTTGAIVSLIALLPRFHAGLNSVLFTNIQYMKQMGEYRQLFSYFDEDAEDERPAPMAFMKEGIDVEGVSFSYEDGAEAGKPLLEGVSLRIPVGTWVSIEGRSGTGKTTLISLLLRLYEPTAGRILLDGTQVQTLNEAWYWAQIAYVGQAPFLFTGTIRENFSAFAPEATDALMIEAMESVCLQELIRRQENPLELRLGEDGAALRRGEAAPDAGHGAADTQTFTCARRGDIPIGRADSGKDRADASTQGGCRDEHRVHFSPG